MAATVRMAHASRNAKGRTVDQTVAVGSVASALREQAAQRTVCAQHPAANQSVMANNAALMAAGVSAGSAIQVKHAMAPVFVLVAVEPVRRIAPANNAEMMAVETSAASAHLGPFVMRIINANRTTLNAVESMTLASANRMTRLQ